LIISKALGFRVETITSVVGGFLFLLAGCLLLLELLELLHEVCDWVEVVIDFELRLFVEALVRLFLQTVLQDPLDLCLVHFQRLVVVLIVRFKVIRA